MRHVIAIAACGFSLVGCTSTSWMPNLDFLKSAPMTETLRFESEPSNAEARLSPTQACRTPCELQVVPTGDLTVTFSLQGYETQAQSVRLLAPGDPNAGSSDFRLYPNPVFAELETAGPTRPGRTPAKKAAPAKRAATPPASAPAARAAPAAASRPAPPSNSPFPPAPAAQFPAPPAPAR